jgi:hypothetical protein
MSKHDKKHLEAILEQVSPTRRKFLRSSLIAGGVAALAAPVSSLLAQEEEAAPAPAAAAAGKGKGKGKGKGNLTGRAGGTEDSLIRQGQAPVPE